MLHLVFAILLPFGLWHLVLEADGNFLGTLVAIVFISTNIWCYGFSAVLHVGRWNVKTEILVQKLDHCGIALLSVGSYQPLATLLLAPQIGVTFTALSMLSCAWTCMNIMRNRPSVLRQAITAGLGILLIPFAYFRMNALEFLMMNLGISSQAVGLVVFVNRYPNPWPKVFGYHEIFHTFVVIAGMTCYLCNWSIIRRTCNPYLHSQDVTADIYSFIFALLDPITEISEWDVE
jgi:hemolysin III